MQDYGGHPPFAHNPHVYDGVDPDGNPTTAMVVESHAVVGETGPEVVDLPRGNVVSLTDAVPPVDEDAPVDVDGDGQITGYELFTKADLVTECETRGLPTSGNKPDLVARLQEADKTAAQPASASNGE